MQLENLRNFNPDLGNFETLLEMYAYGRFMLKEFDEIQEQIGVEVPTWLEQKMRRVKRELLSKIEDRNAKRLADVRLKLEQLKTPGQQKKDLENEARKLEALLAQAGE